MFTTDRDPRFRGETPAWQKKTSHAVPAKAGIIILSGAMKKRCLPIKGLKFICILPKSCLLQEITTDGGRFAKWFVKNTTPFLNSKMRTVS
jgi:hypothetical protein